MRTAKISVIIISCVSLFLINGCSGELNSLRDQNNAQAKRISELSAQLAKAETDLNQLQRQLLDINERGGVDLDMLQQKVALYEKTLAERDALIEQMKQKLLVGGNVITPELNSLLEEFARANPGMVTYDKDKGIVKFSSDLLFNKGSDEVTTSATSAVKTLCGILNSQEALDFDIVVAGHTDDIPIGKAETLKLHPTNWHLSVHRAISVEKIMEASSIDPKRLSVRGFGEYRPVIENAPNKGGAEQNRRVEIYIVPKGA